MNYQFLTASCVALGSLLGLASISLADNFSINQEDTGGQLVDQRRQSVAGVPKGLSSEVPSEVHTPRPVEGTAVEMSVSDQDILQRRNHSQRFKNPTSNNPMGQVTNVNQLRDVEPTAWAYEALRSLVERYGCIVGYPDRTYRGERALTRWEFAAGVNACLNAIERLLQDNVAVLREDIDKLKRLAKEFESELTALGTRIDNLEQRVAFLEDHQFSTTTKLKGEVIFAVVNAWSDDFAVDSGSPPSDREVGNQTTLSDRVRLNFDTSFTGKDLFRTRLQAGNVPILSRFTGSDMARLGFDTGGDNNVFIDKLFYNFPIGNNITTWIGARSLDLDDVFESYLTNPFLDSSGTGALARFNRFNPLVHRGPQGAGLGIKYRFTDTLALIALYLAQNEQSGRPIAGNGLFNGSFSTGAQLQFGGRKSPFNLSVTYLHSYFREEGVNLTGNTGSGIGTNPFGNFAATRDSIGLQGSWRVLPNLNIGGWGGYAKAYAQGDDNEAELWTWNANLSLVDLGTEGAVLSFSGGQLPRAGFVENGRRDRDTSYIIEAQYKFPITNNIILTPGAYVILNPNHNDQNSDIWVGVLRTTFQF